MISILSGGFCRKGTDNVNKSPASGSPFPLVSVVMENTVVNRCLQRVQLSFSSLLTEVRAWLVQ